MFSAMRRHAMTLGRRFGSVGLRYRLPDLARGWKESGCPKITMRGKRGTGEPRGTGEAGALAISRLEAVLFLAREPISSRRLAQLTNLPDGTRARSLLRQLRKSYDARGSAFQVEEVGGGFQLWTRRKFSPWLRRLEATPQQIRLSGPAMETLAVVAYRQPVLRADIEAVRGVQCGELLRQLMDRDLVRIVGRSEELGRPFLYGTTKRFLQLFGLKGLDELPRAALFQAGEIPSSEAVANSPRQSNDMQSGQTTRGANEEESQVMTRDMEQPEPFEMEGRGLLVESIDEDVEFEDDEDDGLEDDEDDDEEDDDEDDLDDEEDDELEGDWEEVDDEDEEDEEDEEDDDWDDDDDEDDDWDDEEEEEDESWEDK